MSFQIRGFHTIDFPAKGGSALPLIVPGKLATGVNDVAGNPFWFDGKVPERRAQHGAVRAAQGHDVQRQPALGQRPARRQGPPKPFKLKFTKPGTYKYFCDVHPGMIGTVVVKPAGKPIPSAKQDAAAQVAQITADIKAAKKVAATKLPADTVSLGESTPGGVELYAMFPTIAHGQRRARW